MYACVMTGAHQSYWLRDHEFAITRLRSSISTQVAVIGAGYTGLSTAYHLAKAGYQVTVLEKEHAGFGASGRNAGHLTPTIGKDLPALLTFFGEEKAQKLVSLAEKAVLFCEKLIKHNRIACDYHAGGNLMAAVDERQLKRLTRAFKAGKKLGAAIEFYEQSSTRKAGLPGAFLGGIFETHGGTLHPGKYLLGLKKACEKMGVTIFEQSPVNKIFPGNRPGVRTDEGMLRADHLVICTNAYSRQLGLFKHTLVPISVSLFETEPLAGQQLKALGWPGRQGIYTAHEVLESYRLSKQNTIIGGSKRIAYGFGARPLPYYQPAMFEAIEGAFRQRFQGLEELPIKSFWSGHIAFTLDFLPTLGRLKRQLPVYYGLSFAGHGIALATYTGEALAHLVQGHDHELLSSPLQKRRVLPIPPEPLAWLAVKSISSFLNLIDKRTDNRLRKK